jgi:hypothetical protein
MRAFGRRAAFVSLLWHPGRKALFGGLPATLEHPCRDPAAGVPAAARPHLGRQSESASGAGLRMAQQQLIIVNQRAPTDGGARELRAVMEGRLRRRFRRQAELPPARRPLRPYTQRASAWRHVHVNIARVSSVFDPPSLFLSNDSLALLVDPPCLLSSAAGSRRAGAQQQPQ